MDLVRRILFPGPIVLAVCLVIGLLAVGCGSGDEPPGDSRSDRSTQETVSSSNTTVGGKTEPSIVVPDGSPPKKLVLRDIELGKGAEARAGDIVTVEYKGLTWAGNSFSNSWTYPEPPTFELGDKRLEYGLDLGFRGMRVGGRREVIVPSTMLYWPGEEHAPLNRENTVVFIADLIALR